MSQDPLIFLPFEKWPDLQSVFKKDFPRGIPGHAVLETQRLLISNGIDYGFRVYCPFGDIENGMVAVNEKEDFYEIIIQCPSDDTTNIRDALKKTTIINWERRIIVPFAPHNIIGCVKKLVQDIGVELKLILPSESFFLDRRTPFEDVNLPPNITFGHLTIEHLEIVNSTWPHRYPTSSWYFKLLMNQNRGYSLFLNENPICWVLINESGALLHMYTIEEFRKKGYAFILLKLVSNILLEDNKHVFAYCLKDNVNACKLYRKLGFTKWEEAAWIYLNGKIK